MRRSNFDTHTCGDLRFWFYALGECSFATLSIPIVNHITITWSECSIVFSLFWKSHCSPCHPVMIQWSECSIVFSLFWKSHCSPCHLVMNHNWMAWRTVGFSK
jgi:hypothetical protein